MSSWARRLAYFWVVWSGLLFVHEGGHAVSAWQQGLTVRAVTVGMGPVLLRTQYRETDILLRLVPVAGTTNLGPPRIDAGFDAHARGADPHGWSEWRASVFTLAGGILATLLVGLVIAAVVAGRERATGRMWKYGRYVVADAVVLTVFNFFPVPPLDGGRALLGTIAAWQGEPLAGDALFWVQAGGMALAVVPMMLWTRWTARIDRSAVRWCMPRPRA